MIRNPLAILFLLMTMLLSVTNSVADTEQTDTAMEYKIKAAFLLNFAKFINWPEESFVGDNQHFKICVLGDNEFGPALEAMKSRSVGNRKIDLQYVDNVLQAESCHLLFISASERDNLETIQTTLGDHAVTTVSDITGFASSGGIIEFVTRDNKLTFNINLRRARERGLEIPSALLNLATEVIQ